MKTANVLAAVLRVLTAVVVVALYLRMSSIDADRQNETRKLENALQETADSLQTLRLEIDSIKGQLPGLGEYMTSIQLHASKLWYAAQSSNWDLAQYEYDELGEAMDGAEALHAIKNKIDITSVMLGVRQSQLPLVQQAMQSKNLAGFKDAYAQTLAACNSCHSSSGHGFIHIITPTGLPVTNQDFKPQVK
jgi:cytochrome c556